MADNSSSNKTKNAPGNKPAPKKATSNKPAAATKSEGLGLPQQVDLMWVVAIAVVCFVLGFFIHSLFVTQPGTTIPPTSALSSGGIDPATNPNAAPGAPTLTEDQVNSGQLPSGHPDVNAGAPAPGTGAGTSTAAPATSGMTQSEIDALTGFTKGGTSTGHGSTGGMGGRTSDVPASGATGASSVVVPEDKDPSKKK